MFFFGDFGSSTSDESDEPIKNNNSNNNNRNETATNNKMTKRKPLDPPASLPNKGEALYYLERQEQFEKQKQYQEQQSVGKIPLSATTTKSNATISSLSLFSASQQNSYNPTQQLSSMPQQQQQIHRQPTEQARQLDQVPVLVPSKSGDTTAENSSSTTINDNRNNNNKRQLNNGNDTRINGSSRNINNIINNDNDKDGFRDDEINVQHNNMKPFSLSASAHSGMEASVLRFDDLSFVVGSAEKPKYILSNCSGKIKWGQVLAIMGPSGAGKSTLIKTLTLDALYGKPTGTITLNGIKLSDKIFKNHCYVVEQYDTHWPYLTCRETLLYAGELYQIAGASRSDLELAVDNILEKMGLQVCAYTRCARLSGGQRRRLSIGMALLKQPTVLFLDEPTTSLDAASAANIMKEIVRVAKMEHLIIVCTIHQPSSKVYNRFDQVMIMSRGRQAYNGDVKEAVRYFNSIGYPCPAATNPAEFFLDLVNSDFSDEENVKRILDLWDDEKVNRSTTHGRGRDPVDDEDGQEGVAELPRSPILVEMAVMFRRHFTLIVRDPILYVGRCFVFFAANALFALVYYNARNPDQDQAQNKAWLQIWFVAIPTNMCVVAVYVLNTEFKSILRENRNGMLRGLSYVLAKSILVIPIFFIFGLFALGIPAFVIQGIEPEAFAPLIVLFGCCLFAYECVAECMSVWFEDPIIAMLQYINVWFASFLFGGFLIGYDDMYWPMKLFYHILPLGYYVRSAVYQTVSVVYFGPCEIILTAVCIPEGGTGFLVLDKLNDLSSLYSSKDETAKDLMVMTAIGICFKIFYVIGVYYKASRFTKVEPPEKVKLS